MELGGNGTSSIEPGNDFYPRSPQGQQQQQQQPLVPEPPSTPPINRRPSENLRAVWVNNLARKHRLGAHEVKRIVEQFDFAQGKAGTLNITTLREVLCEIFEHPEIDEKVVESAWEATTSEPPEEGIQVHQFDMDSFLTWYVANMFMCVAKLTANKEQVDVEGRLSDLAQQFGVTAYAMDKVKRRFDQYDVDHSGMISYSEFDAMMRKILGAKAKADMSDDRMVRFWQEIDIDGNGQVDLAEFTQWYLKYFDPDMEDGLRSVQAFYGSFNPEQQRRNGLVNRIASEV